MSKFKVKSVGTGNFVTHFQHDRAQSCAQAQIQPSLIEVYEAEIRRLRKKNFYLRIQHNPIITQLKVLAHLQQANAKAENCRDWKCFLQHEKGLEEK